MEKFNPKMWSKVVWEVAIFYPLLLRFPKLKKEYTTFSDNNNLTQLEFIGSS